MGKAGMKIPSEQNTIEPNRTNRPKSTYTLPFKIGMENR